MDILDFLNFKSHKKNFLFFSRYLALIEIPPAFLDGQPKIPPGYEGPIPACIKIPQNFAKNLIIKLADEGLIVKF